MDIFEFPNQSTSWNLTRTDIISFLELDIENGPWIAGGTARKMYTNSAEPDSDFDVWCKTQAQYDDLLERISRNLSWLFRHSSDNAVTFSSMDNQYMIQLIKKTFDSPEDVIGSFDFTVSQVLTDGHYYRLGPTTAADLNTRTLRYNDTKLRDCAIPRILKYIAYGFKPDEKLWNMIIEQSGEIEWNKTYTY